MDREAVRRKIKNLLALAESDNENEALAAVQAARKLMMKYHISVEEEKGKEGIQKNIVVKGFWQRIFGAEHFVDRNLLPVPVFWDLRKMPMPP